MRFKQSKHWVRWVVGADFGQRRDHSAISILSRQWEIDVPEQGSWAFEDLDPDAAVLRYDLTDVIEIPLGTRWPYVIQRLAEIMGSEQIRSEGGRLVVDATGLGAPLLADLREQGIGPVLGINVTAGQSESASQADSAIINLGKQPLVTALQVAFERGKIRLGAGVPERFEEQLLNFGPKINRRTGNVAYEAIDESQHDDLVISSSLCFWFASTKLSKVNPIEQRLGYYEDQEVYDPMTQTVRRV